MIDNIPRLLTAIMTTDPGAPWCLDLFCGAGGAGMGYKLAGFNVLGVDIKPQPRYPGWFVQADALEFARAYGQLFDMIHASPPCQANSALKNMHQHKDEYAKHIDMIDDTRAILDAVGVPYVIENVPGAKRLRPCVMLCGAQLGLKVYRHRYFESTFLLLAPPHALHHDDMIAAGRGLTSKGFVCVTGNGGFGFEGGTDYARQAMGVTWTTRAELSQAIPPAYTHYIGKQMMRAIAR